MCPVILYQLSLRAEKVNITYTIHLIELGRRQALNPLELRIVPLHMLLIGDGDLDEEVEVAFLELVCVDVLPTEKPDALIDSAAETFIAPAMVIIIGALHPRECALTRNITDFVNEP